MTRANQIPKGRTGQKVLSSGTYRCGDNGEIASFIEGDTFGSCPSSGKRTTWEKTHEPSDQDPNGR